MISQMKTLTAASIVAALALLTTACAAQTQADNPVATVAPIPVSAQSGRIEISAEIHRSGDVDARTAIIVIGGSGVGERSDTSQAIPLFLNSSQDVVIFDRRGHGQSGGEAIRPGTENSAWLIPAHADDVIALAAALRQRGYDHVGLVGSSMGGWIAVSATARSQSVDFLVSIVGGAVSVQVSDAFDVLTDQGMARADAAREAAALETTLGYDPAEDLSALSQPALFVLAEADTSNPSRLDVRNIEMLQADGVDIRYILVPDADHNFVNTITGEPELGWVSEMHAFIELTADQ